MPQQLNIFGQPLQLCSALPLTGYTRSGYCELVNGDTGTHTVCAVVTDDFLQYTASKGNDLVTPRNRFPGLKAGDRWCLCALRWLEAYYAGSAPFIDGNATNIMTLRYIPAEILSAFVL